MVDRLDKILRTSRVDGFDGGQERSRRELTTGRRQNTSGVFH